MGFIRKHDQPKGQITDINEYRGRKAAAQRDAAHNPSPDYRVKDIHPLEAHYQSQVDLPKQGMKRPSAASRPTTKSIQNFKVFVSEATTVPMDWMAKKLGLLDEDKTLFTNEPFGAWTGRPEEHDIEHLRNQKENWQHNPRSDEYHRNDTGPNTEALKGRLKGKKGGSGKPPKPPKKPPTGKDPYPEKDPYWHKGDDDDYPAA